MSDDAHSLTTITTVCVHVHITTVCVHVHVHTHIVVMVVYALIN
jgi:hypothetical protein